MKSLAIIPAKAKSNRLPNKNMRDFWGKPLYEWSLWAALDSGIFDRIVITTDIPQIKYSKMLIDVHGLDIIDRPPDLATDEATMLEVVLDLLKYYSNYADFCVLYPTAPLRTEEDIRKSYELFVDGEYEGVIGGTKFIQPWWQSFESWVEDDGRKYWRVSYPVICGLREEDLRETLTDNGALYWVRTNAFLAQKTFFPNNLGIYEMPYERSIDINTETDFRLAEYFAKQ